MEFKHSKTQMTFTTLFQYFNKILHETEDEDKSNSLSITSVGPYASCKEPNNLEITAIPVFKDIAYRSLQFNVNKIYSFQDYTLQAFSVSSFQFYKQLYSLYKRNTCLTQPTLLSHYNFQVKIKLVKSISCEYIYYSSTNVYQVSESLQDNIKKNTNISISTNQDFSQISDYNFKIIHQLHKDLEIKSSSIDSKSDSIFLSLFPSTNEYKKNYIQNEISPFNSVPLNCPHTTKINLLKSLKSLNDNDKYAYKFDNKLLNKQVIMSSQKEHALRNFLKNADKNPDYFKKRITDSLFKQSKKNNGNLLSEIEKYPSRTNRRTNNIIIDKNDISVYPNENIALLAEQDEQCRSPCKESIHYQTLNSKVKSKIFRAYNNHLLSNFPIGLTEIKNPENNKMIYRFTFYLVDDLTCIKIFLDFHDLNLFQMNENQFHKWCLGNSQYNSMDLYDSMKKVYNILNRNLPIYSLKSIAEENLCLVILSDRFFYFNCGCFRGLQFISENRRRVLACAKSLLKQMK